MQNHKQNRKAWARQRMRAMERAVDTYRLVTIAVDKGQRPNMMALDVALGELVLSGVAWEDTQFGEAVRAIQKAANKIDEQEHKAAKSQRA